MQTQTNAQGSAIRLIPTPPKAAHRLLRSALRHETEQTNADYFETENRYLRVSSSLVHLCNHMPFKSDVERMAENLVKDAFEFIGTQGAQTLYTRESFTKLVRATHNLKSSIDSLLQRFEVTLDDIKAYLRVADELRTRYLAEDYNPLAAINAAAYAQALLIAENFQAYERTLNEH